MKQSRTWLKAVGVFLSLSALLILLPGYDTSQTITNTTVGRGGPPFETEGKSGAVSAAGTRVNPTGNASVVLDSADTYSAVVYLGDCIGRIWAAIEAWPESTSVTGDTLFMSTLSENADSLDYRFQAKWFRDDAWVAVDSLLYWDTGDSSFLIRSWDGIGVHKANMFPGRWIRLYVGQQGLASSVGDSNWVGFDTSAVRFMIDCEH